MVWHPFTQMKTARPPIPITSGKGAYLYGKKGERYLDAISSWWVNLHGHAHPYIAEKIALQAKKLEHVIFAGFTHAPAVELAERLLALLPGNMARIFYSDNGSTAVEVALKMALQYNVGKKKVICLKNSYHGDTFGAMSAAGRNRFNKPFWSHLFEVISVDPNSITEMEAALQHRDVACFIFEPLVLAAGGMILYPGASLDSFIRLCRSHDVLTIADEVMTGFGRTGTLFACEQLQESPDMICLSKGLTGGFLPLGATACTERIYEAFLGDSLDKAFLHGHSYTGNPLACVSALASLDLLLQESCRKQRSFIEKRHKQFCDKWRHHPKLKRCESLGTLLVLEYPHLESPYTFIDQHVLLRPLGNVVYALPPYCLQPDEIDTLYQALETTL